MKHEAEAVAEGEHQRVWHIHNEMKERHEQYGMKCGFAVLVSLYVSASCQRSNRVHRTKHFTFSILFSIIFLHRHINFKFAKLF